MYPPDNFIFNVVKTLVTKYGAVLPAYEWDAFSETEKVFLCPDQNLYMAWAKRIVSENGKIISAECIEILDSSLEDEAEVVFQALLKPEGGLIETYFYFPDEWVDELLEIGLKDGIIPS